MKKKNESTPTHTHTHTWGACLQAVARVHHAKVWSKWNAILQVNLDQLITCCRSVGNIASCIKTGKPVTLCNDVNNNVVYVMKQKLHF